MALSKALDLDLGYFFGIGEEKNNKNGFGISFGINSYANGSVSLLSAREIGYIFC